MTARFLILPFAIAALSAPALAQQAAPPHVESFIIKGAVEHEITFKLADLQKEEKASATISQHTGKGTLSGNFSGVSLWALLQKAGIKGDKGKKNDNIHHTVTVSAGDGYNVVLSLGEIDPEFGGDKAFIAYEKDGKFLDDKYGFARLIIPGDYSAGRAIDGVTTIEIH